MNNINFAEEIQIKLLEWLNATETFVLEQAPDVAQQILAWGVAYSHIEIFFGWTYLVLIFGFMAVFILGCRHLEKCKSNTEWKGAIAISVSVILILIFSVAAPKNLYSGYVRLIKIDTAPKIYLLEHIVCHSP